MHPVTGTCLSGSCICGDVRCDIQLPQPAAAYAPRRCDCDFCTAQQLLYLSDAKGQLRIRANTRLTRIKQGSEQAEFLACSQCQTIVAVCYREAGICVGAINASLLQPQSQFAAAVTVQPKLLAADTKTERWKQLWTPLVVVEDEVSDTIS